MKVSRSGDVVPFLHCGMVARKLSTDDPIVATRPQKYGYGAYIVTNRAERDKNARVKNLFIVDVAAKHVEDGLIFTADHFSFMIKHSDKSGKKLHLHRTEYVPISKERGRILRSHNHLPLTFELPTSAETFKHGPLVRADFKPWASWLYDVITAHRIANMSDQSGGSKRRRAARVRRVQTFEDIWWNLPIESILVFAVPTPQHPHHHDVTIIVKDRLRKSPSATWPSFHARVAASEASTDVGIRNIVARAMRDVVWEDFEEIQSDG
jgi:hypothetical protein